MTGLGRGINLGNALDAPAGGLPLRERYFDAISRAGFDTVRLPVQWSAHAGTEPPYEIDPDFFTAVDRAVHLALRRGLNVVLNLHHYHALNASPGEHTGRFLGLWRQIAPHYAGHPDGLCLELLNEPRHALTPDRWNRLLAEALAVVRRADPERRVIVGSAEMNDVAALGRLVLPADERLIATVHYYAPFAFTHQGAHWVPGSAPWLGTTWGSAADRDAVRHDLDLAAGWAREQGVPLFVGEFGAYDKADPDSRARWTRCVREECEQRGLSWAYWDFGTDFGAYDPAADAWREPIRHALLSEPISSCRRNDRQDPNTAGL